MMWSFQEHAHRWWPLSSCSWCCISDWATHCFMVLLSLIVIPGSLCTRQSTENLSESLHFSELYCFESWISNSNLPSFKGDFVNRGDTLNRWLNWKEQNTSDFSQDAFKIWEMFIFSPYETISKPYTTIYRWFIICELYGLTNYSFLWCSYHELNRFSKRVYND